MKCGVIIAATALIVAGCMPAKSPTEALRAAVVMAAEAVERADQTCADIGSQKKDAALLTLCKDSYNIARPALIAAQYYIEVGDESGLEASLCTGQRALAATASAVSAAGAKVPPLVTEAIRFAGSVCGGPSA